MRTELNQDSLPEFIGQIVDIFEDFCDDNNISIENSERDDYLEDDPDNPCAIIFGDDYDAIGNEISYAVNNLDLMNKNISETDLNQTIQSVIDEFTRIITRDDYIENNNNNAAAMTSENIAMLSEKITDTFERWHIYNKN